MKKRLFLNTKELAKLDKGQIIRKRVSADMTADIDYGNNLRYVLKKIAITIRKDGKAKVFLLVPQFTVALSNQDACAMLKHDMNEWLKKQNE